MSFSKKKPVSDARRPTTGAASRIYSRENIERYSERARQRRRGKKIRRGILITVLCVFLGAATAAGMWFSRIVGNLNDGSLITEGLLHTLVDSDVTSEPFYMLLLGTDGRPGEEQYRADSIILARIDPTEKQVTLISIPRDTKITYKGSTIKINAAHVDDGAEGMVNAVNELCGIKISHYAEINFEGMEQLIDAVGGIDINATDPVDDPEHLDIKIEPGFQHMDGATALTYARCRYIYTDGDYTRMRHQRQVIGALAKTILEKVDPGSLLSLVDSLSNMVITDMSVQDIVALANAMRGMDVDAIWSANIPSWAGEDTYINGQSYVFVYEAQLAEMMERVDAGEDPQGPQSMGTSSESSTIGDLSNNTSDDFASGTDTSSSGSSSDEADASSAE